MATLGNVLTYIDTVYPNKFGSTMKISFINDEQRKIFKFMNPSGMATFNTVADQFSYALPSDCDIDQIQQVLVTSSTEAVDSETTFDNYEFAGLDQEMSGGNFYYDVFGKIGVFPVPDKNGYTGRIIYSKRPVLFTSTDDSAVELNLEEDWLDYIKFRVISRIAKSGSYPDIDLANNYEADAMEIERRLKMDRANRKMKNPRERISYQEGWDF
jgi:hypothetical protein